MSVLVAGLRCVASPEVRGITTSHRFRYMALYPPRAWFSKHGLLLVLWISFVLVVQGDWLDDWRQRHTGSQGRTQVKCTSGSEPLCELPPYLPPHSLNSQELRSHEQLIPRIIWQTWKSYAVGPKQCQAMVSIINSNPEYEYVLLDDAAAAQFMCEHMDAATNLAYESLVPGAAKADILRVAVLLKYGGIYFDSDCEAVAPLSSFIWPNASVVSGIGEEGDFHQWALLYQAGHMFLQRALQSIVHNVLCASTAKLAQSVVSMTGPHAFHYQGVALVLADYNCTVSARVAQEHNMHLLTSQSPCPGLPEALGNVQLFDTDFLGGNVKFKADGVDHERQAAGQKYYTILEQRPETLFAVVDQTCKLLKPYRFYG